MSIGKTTVFPDVPAKAAGAVSARAATSMAEALVKNYDITDCRMKKKSVPRHPAHGFDQEPPFREEG